MSPFRREVRAAMARMSKDLEKDVDEQGNRIGDRLGRRIREAMNRSVGTDQVRRQATIGIRTHLDRTSVARTEATVARVTRDREIDVRINRRSTDEVQSFGRALGTVFARSFTVIDRLFASIIDISERVPGAGFAIGATVIAAIFELIGLIGFATDALLGLASTFPLVGAVGAAAIAPLFLIFSNLGDAFGALTKDAGEFQNAIEILGEDTQFVFRRLREGVEFFTDIREQLQENFFGPIRGALEDLDTGPLSTVFAAGFGGVSTAAGELVADFIRLFEHPRAAKFFQDVFRLAELTFNEVGGAILEMVEAFTAMANETIPDVEAGIRGVGDLIRGWADSLKEFVRTGEFREWLDESQRKLGVITDLLGSGWDLIRTIVNQTSDDVDILLQEITEIIDGLNQFFQTETGETVLEGMRITLELIGTLVAGILIAFGGIFFTLGLIGRAIDSILGDTEELRNLAVEITEIFTGIEFNLLGWQTNLAAVVALITFMVSPITIIGLLVFNLIRNWETVGTRIAGALELALGLALATSGDLTGAASRLASGWQKVTGAIDKAGREAGKLRGNTSSSSSFLAQARDRANQLADALFRAARNSSQIRTGGVSGGPNLILAEGGIFTTRQHAIVGESGPEVVIPLTRPRRARELIEATNLEGLIRGGDGAVAIGGRTSSPAGPAPVVQVHLITDGSRAGRAVLELLRTEVRIQGGNVQEVVGSRGRTP